MGGVDLTGIYRRCSFKISIHVLYRHEKDGVRCWHHCGCHTRCAGGSSAHVGQEEACLW